VGNVVAIDDVVVPVSLASLKSGVLESKGTLPGARLGGGLVPGERELADVAVPRAEEVDRLDAGRDAKRERELNRRHYYLLVMNSMLLQMLLTVLGIQYVRGVMGVMGNCEQVKSTISVIRVLKRGVIMCRTKQGYQCKWVLSLAGRQLEEVSLGGDV
jgi:hypothetical protein